MLKFSQSRITSTIDRKPRTTMSKTVILLCVLIGACTVQESVGTMTEKVIGMKMKIDEMIKAALQTYTDKFQKIKDMRDQVATEIKKKATAILEGLKDQATKFMQRLDEKMAETLKGLTESEQELCAKAFVQANQTMLAVVGNSSMCLVDLMEENSAYMERINQHSLNMRQSLSSLANEAEECCKDLKGVESAWNGFMCMQKVWYRGTKLAVITLPGIAKDMTVLAWKCSTMLGKIALCSSTTAIGTAIEAFDDVVSTARACVEQKLGKRETGAHYEVVPSY